MTAPATATALLKAECNRYVNGACHLARCVRRGMAKTGKSFPLSDYAIATCEHNEAVKEIETARDLIKCLIENDPNDYAADAVTVFDVWRRDAEKFLQSTEP